MDDSVFSYCTALTSASLPDGMEELPDKTFFNCTALTSVSLPRSLYSIGERAFYNCRALTNISIPSLLEEIKSEAFAYCVNLQSVKLPQYLSTLGEGAFSYCSRLQSVNIPAELGTLEDDLFAYDQMLSSVTIEDGLRGIGDGVFYDCTKLYTLVVPDSVQDIGRSAFGDNTTLRGSSDSYVRAYANSKGYTFKLKSDPSSDIPAGANTGTDNGSTNTDLIYNGVQYAGSVMIDTNTYTMAPGNIYDIGVVLAGNAYTKTINVYSSRTGIATVQRLANGNYRVTGKAPGTCYVVVDVLSGSTVLNHVSIRFDVAYNVTQHGQAARNRSYFN